MAFGLAALLFVAACDPQTPSTSPPATTVPLTSDETAAPTNVSAPVSATPPAPTVQPSAGDLPDMDPVAIFGAGVKLTGTEIFVPGEIARAAVLALTSSSFGVATECIGQGRLTVEVSRPVEQPEPGALPYEIIASYRVPCPTTVVETLVNDTGEIGSKTSLNVGVQEAGEGVSWRVILVDLRP
jgi:hypothetical protein